MTKKDQTPSENIDLAKSEKQGSSPEENGGQQDSKETESSTKIENAHAAGDGAYGRSDKSVLGENEAKDEGHENEPAY